MSEPTSELTSEQAPKEDGKEGWLDFIGYWLKRICWAAVLCFIGLLIGLSLWMSLRDLPNFKKQVFENFGRPTTASSSPAALESKHGTNWYVYLLSQDGRMILQSTAPRSLLATGERIQWEDVNGNTFFLCNRSPFSFLLSEIPLSFTNQDKTTLMFLDGPLSREKARPSGKLL